MSCKSAGVGSHTALLALCTASLAAQSSFQGVVIDAATGQPLRKADVQLSGERGSHTPKSRVVTGRDGHFQALGLDPGVYKVHVERQGYLDCDCLSGVKISTGQKLTGVQIKLTKYGAISGRVVDADGDVWPRGSVEVYRLDWKGGKRQLLEQDQSDVDDRGMFRVAKLPPGRYFLAAQPTGGFADRPQTYQTTFYPGTLEPAAATPIQLAPGQEMSAVELKLQSADTYRIRGRIAGMDLTEFNGRTAGSRLTVGIYRDSGLFEDWLAAPVDRNPDGSFEFRDVPSGSYTIKLQAMSGLTPSPATYRLGKLPFK